jgi:hypothetical protein
MSLPSAEMAGKSVYSVLVLLTPNRTRPARRKAGTFDGAIYRATSNEWDH